MQAVSGIMLSIMAMAALSAFAEAFSESAQPDGVSLVTGLCAAACMLNACRMLMTGIV